MLNITNDTVLIGITELREDIVLGYLAKERDEKSTEKDFIDEIAMLKRLGLSVKPT